MPRAGSATSQNLIDALMHFRKVHHHHQPVEGVRQSEFWVLATLKRSHDKKDPGVRVSDLARKLDVATPTATQMIIRLENSGHVERRRSKEDGRIVHVVLTQKGSKTVEHVQKSFVSQFDSVVDFLGEKDSNTFADLLNRVSDFLDKS